MKTYRSWVVDVKCQMSIEYTFKNPTAQAKKSFVLISFCRTCFLKVRQAKTGVDRAVTEWCYQLYVVGNWFLVTEDLKGGFVDFLLLCWEMIRNSTTVLLQFAAISFFGESGSCKKGVLGHVQLPACPLLL